LCGTITLFTSFTALSQEQNTKGELRAIQVPVFANETERQEWIAAHPDEYKFLTGQYKEEKVEAVDSNGFPQFINTGDPEKDGKIYQERKQAWIIAHPEEYKQMIENQLNKNK
jgi:hypothetical protein